MDRSEDEEPKGREAALFQVRDGGKPRVAQPPQRDQEARRAARSRRSCRSGHAPSPQRDSVIPKRATCPNPKFQLQTRENRGDIPLSIENKTEGEAMATTYNNLFLDTRARLRKAGIEAGQLEARELICYAADKSREQFYRDMPLYVSGEMERRVEELVQRRLAGEPVAYIVGEWEFYGLPLNISNDVLIPRIDTEVLAERGILRARAAGEGARVLDLCAGSGCVGLAIAANAPDCRVVLGELSEGALRVCKQNVRRNELNARVTCLSVNAMEPPASSLWDFDVIVSNPPYIPTGDIEGLDHSVKDYEPHMALDGGADGLDFYRFIAAKWKNAIRLGGSLIFEVGIGQAPDVENILAQNGFEQIQTTADTQGIWRVVEGTING